MKKVFKIVLLAGVLAGGAVSAKAQTPVLTPNGPIPQVADLAQMKDPALWVKNYRDLDVAINVSDRTELGITRDDVQTEVGERLHQAGIRPRTDFLPSGPITAANGPFLEVALTNTDEYAVVEIRFWRAAFWTLPNGATATSLAPTWWDTKAAVRSGKA